MKKKIETLGLGGLDTKAPLEWCDIIGLTVTAETPLATGGSVYDATRRVLRHGTLGDFVKWLAEYVPASPAHALPTGVDGGDDGAGRVYVARFVGARRGDRARRRLGVHWTWKKSN